MTDIAAQPTVDTGPPVPTGPVGQRRIMAGVGLGIAVATLVTLAVGGPLRAPVALAFACLGPGVAVLSHLRVRGPAAIAWSLALLISVAGYAATATVAVWADWWRPRTIALVGAAAMIVLCLAALVRTRAGSPATGPGAGRATGPGADPKAGRATGPGRWFRPRRNLIAHLAVLAVGTALWLIALAGTDIDRVGEYGLLATIHPTFFVAVALCAGGFAVGLTRAGRLSGALPGYLVLLILIIHGSTPLLLDQPQYAWTFKHLGVVEFIQAHGTVSAPTDIYQQWPALFAAVAQLADLSGITAFGLADWSAVFFNLAGALVLFAVARTLNADPRVAYLTVFGFLCVNWVEEDYLSPQALAFLLSLGAILVLLRWLRRPAAGPDPVAGPEGDPDAGPVGAPSRRTRAVALAGFLALFAVLTAAHQLSPYLVFAQVTALVLLRLVRPWYVSALAGGILLIYLLPRYGLVSGSFGLFEGINIFANAAGNAEGWGSTGQAFSAVVVRTLALTVWGAAALAVLRARHRRWTVGVPVILAVTPFILLTGQSYGGEAIYRVFLFSAPWCVYLIAAAAFAPGGGHRRSRPTRAAAMVAVLGLVLTLAALATIQGRHGQLVVDRQTTAEVRAARHLYTNAVPGSTIALATSNFPSRLTGAYGMYNRTLAVGEPELIKGAGLRGASLGAEHIPVIEGYLRGFDGTATYLVISDGMRRQAGYFGYLPAGALDRLDAALDAAPGWSIFYRDDDVTVHQLIG